MNQLASTTSDQRRWPNPRLGRISAAIAIALALAHVPVHAETSAVAGQDSTQQQTADASPQSSPNTKKINTPSSEKQPANLSAVTVTGVRASLESAIAIKRDSDQIVDSIVAEDIASCRTATWPKRCSVFPASRSRAISVKVAPLPFAA